MNPRSDPPDAGDAGDDGDDGDAEVAIPGVDADEAQRWLDLRGVLGAYGVTDDEVDQATASGTLELLALERILEGAGTRYDLDEVAEESGIDPDHILELWRALGFPEPRPGEKVFSDTDLEMLEDTVPFIAEGGLDTDLALQMTRVIGSSVARIATSQVDAIASELQERRRLVEEGDEAVEAPWEGEVAQRAAELLPMMPKVMEFVWRRHLVNAARRRILRTTDAGATVVVGFADLVGFTAQTQQLEEHELATVVGRFEHLAHDLVTINGGRVVKMIGDEVMFTADDVPTGASIALALAEAYRRDEAFSDVRVGMAAGEVLERDGDLYGPVVNLANRIVNVAFPGAVVVDGEVAEALAERDDVIVKSIRSHYLKDIGKVRLYSLRRDEIDDGEQRYSRAQQRRMDRRQFLVDRRVQHQRDAAALSRGLPVPLPIDLADDAFLDEPTAQLEAITDAVLDADVDTDLQAELLADIEVARRLDALEQQAQAKAAEADEEAERKILDAERDARRRVEEIERDARIRIEQALTEAEARAERANDEAARKVRAVAREAERRADQVEREARRTARRKAERRAARRRTERAKEQVGEATTELVEGARELGDELKRGVEDVAGVAIDAATAALEAFRPPQSTRWDGGEDDASDDETPDGAARDRPGPVDGTDAEGAVDDEAADADAASLGGQRLPPVSDTDGSPGA